MASLPAHGGYAPSPADIDAVLDWFTRYDTLAVGKEVEAMADQAMFPLNEVTDGYAASCDREKFVAQMREQLGEAGDVSMDSVRTPHFINENLVFVITDAIITAGEHSQHVRYGDLLVKTGDGWKFQTMVQGGWGEF
ncbi:nuclear transport factor 2 family protein [Mycobacterium sp. pW049]|uniref:nuclear transport factor 2 family protein n=1 Tax=[Mycobacterium] bulgaricum TaxID=3238985 RepID=UPI00351B2F8C